MAQRLYWWTLVTKTKAPSLRAADSGNALIIHDWAEFFLSADKAVDPVGFDSIPLELKYQYVPECTQMIRDRWQNRFQ